ncbi:cell division protein FtsZ [Synechococcus sp. RS9916]|nr:cell division protein FtsZ [Synechococcus sp. RS9916]
MRRLLLAHPTFEGLHAELPALDQGRAKWWLLGSKPQQISRHAHLAVTTGTGTNPDHRNRQLGAQVGRQLRGDVLQHQGKTSSRLKVERLTLQFLLAAGILGLAAVPEAMHRLGGEAEMTHHRNSHAHQPIDHSHHLRLGPFQLDGRGT